MHQMGGVYCSFTQRQSDFPSLLQTQTAGCDVFELRVSFILVQNEFASLLLPFPYIAQNLYHDAVHVIWHCGIRPGQYYKIHHYPEKLHHMSHNAF